MNRRLWLTALVAGLLAASCGGGGGDAEPTSSESSPSASATSTTGPGDTGITSAADTQAAVVRIVAEGTFVDPEVGLQLNAAGSGSGFIIDPTGIAVTNNHVVTGSALLQVYVSGEDAPRNAVILGVSECSDLAVIDIDGDGFPSLAFHEDPIQVGLEIYAAGYPLGDPEFTLTRGIVSKANASGETSWASVDGVIEHDAKINPGNSGGPLVDAQGRVVGVNYAGAAQTDQNYAIAAALAEPLVQQLRGGVDVDTVGINGEAVFDQASDTSGIWVSSVKSGSPADNAGIQAGDIVTRLEGLLLATDGTMSDYCDVLRSRQPTDVMKVEVLRYATSEVLEGELNGDPLVQSFSFAQQYDEQVAAGGGDQTYGDFTAVSDDSGVITVEIPAAWSDIDGTENPDFGPSLYAAPDLDLFLNSWSEPGMILEASTDYTLADADAVLDDFGASEACTSQERDDYEDPLYVGRYEIWTDCEGTDAMVVGVAAGPAEGGFIIRLLVQVKSPADLDAVDHILNTFVANL